MTTANLVSRLQSLIQSKPGTNQACENTIEFHKPTCLGLRSEAIDCSEAAKRADSNQTVLAVESRTVDGYTTTTSTRLFDAKAVDAYLRVEGENADGRYGDYVRIARKLDRIESAGGNGRFYSIGKWLDATYVSFLPSSPAQAAMDLGKKPVQIYEEVVEKVAGRYYPWQEQAIGGRKTLVATLRSEADLDRFLISIDAAPTDGSGPTRTAPAHAPVYDAEEKDILAMRAEQGLRMPEVDEDIRRQREFEGLPPLNRFGRDPSDRGPSVHG